MPRWRTRLLSGCRSRSESAENGSSADGCLARTVLLSPAMKEESMRDAKNTVTLVLTLDGLGNQMAYVKKVWRFEADGTDIGYGGELPLCL